MDKRLGGIIYYSHPYKKFKVLIKENLSKYFILPYETGKKLELIKYKHKYKNILKINIKNTEVLFVFIVSKIPFLFVKRYMEKMGLKVLSSYIIVPNFHEPRWFIPFNKKLIANIGNIIKPSSPRAIFAWKLMHLLNKLGWPQLLFSNQIIMVAKKDLHLEPEGMLIDFFYGLFKKKDIDFVLYTGAYGYQQKFVAQVMDRNGEIIGFAKMAYTEETKKRINHEVEIFKILKKKTFYFMEYPRTIFFGEHEVLKNIILVQYPPPPEYKIFYKKLTSKHIVTLAELFKKTVRSPQESKYLLSEINKSYEYIKKLISSKPENNFLFKEDIPFLIEKAIVQLHQGLKNKKITIGLSHGDFTPWNIYLGKSKLYIFDWEIADFRVPLWDFYNFLIHSEVFIYSKNYNNIVTEIFENNRNTSLLIKKYEKELGDKIYFNKKLFLIIYLIQVIAYYLDHISTQEKFGFEIEKSITRILTSMINILKFIIL